MCQKIERNFKILGPVHENRIFQFYDETNPQYYSNSSFFDQPPLQVPPPSYQKYVCNYCGRCFKKESYLRYHLNSHAGYRPHMCNICGKSFTRVSILRKHRITVHHKNHYMGYNCMKCGKEYSFKYYNYYYHCT